MDGTDQRTSHVDTLHCDSLPTNKSDSVTTGTDAIVVEAVVVCTVSNQVKVVIDPWVEYCIRNGQTSKVGWSKIHQVKKSGRDSTFQ